MTREDINDIINAICPNDEDYEKPCISPKYLRQELEQLAVDQRQWNEEPTTKNNLGVDSVDRGKEPCYTCRFCKINSHGSIYCSLREKGGKCYDHDSWELQEDVLDKIRAEIEELDNKVCQQFLIEDIDKEVHRTYRECIDILDKYKAESEDK